MINFLKTKKIVLLFFLILIIIFLTLLFSISNQKNRINTGQNLNLTPTEELGLQVVEINPNPVEPLPLIAGQSITLEFNQEIKLNTISVSLARKNIQKDESVNIPFNIEEINPGNLIKITISEIILPSNEYLLKILDKNKNKIYTAGFVSEDIKPTPVEKNNIELSNFLPYETVSFKLSYNEERNIYIFNFKYSEQSSDSLLDQYEKAKKEAIEFIKSNNIDIDSIVIEWRYS